MGGPAWEGVMGRHWGAGTAVWGARCVMRWLDAVVARRVRVLARRRRKNRMLSGRRAGDCSSLRKKNKNCSATLLEPWCSSELSFIPQSVLYRNGQFTGEGPAE